MAEDIVSSTLAESDWSREGYLRAAVYAGERGAPSHGAPGAVTALRGLDR